MKTNELRIGNLVLVDNEKYHPKVAENRDLLKVVGLSMSPSGYSVQLNTLDVSTQIVSPFMCQLLKYIKPIPLTEEWLIKFGFLEIGEKLYCKRWRLNRVDIYKMISGVNPFYFRFNQVDLKITHVHQLQNLHFALTNEELTIK